jgi:3-deoxy-manno-octulosonate cytidylyltransferase (CMP-KDO synthetase)
VLVCAVRVLTIIPARIGSTRLPEKPLRTIRGEPLTHLVARNVIEYSVSDEVAVASDDRRVLETVRPLGVRGVMTSSAPRSGTERIAEVLKRPEYSDADVVLNVQCDQPFLPLEAVKGAISKVEAGFEIGTAAVPFPAPAEADGNIVKVVVGSDGRAVHFSRGRVGAGDLDGAANVFHHLGVYAYTRESVLKWVALPECPEEFAERLEQLRPLLHGMSIGVELINGMAPLAIDTLADLRRAQGTFGQTRGQSRKSA